MSAALHSPSVTLPRPPMPTRERSQLESFLVLRRNPLELWGERAYTEDILVGTLFGRQQMLVNAPDAVRHVMVTNAANYQRGAGTQRMLRPVIGQGVFLAEGAPWRHQRRTIAPAFSPRSIPILAGHVVHEAATQEAVFDALAHRPIELMPHFQRLALAIAARSMFSLEVAEFGPRLRALLTIYARKHAQPGVLDLILPAKYASPLDRGRQRFRVTWQAFFGELIDARAALPTGEGPRDLFDLLADARDPETGEGFSRSQLSDEIATMIVAGHETTSTTLFWASYLAARFPEQQERMAREADGVDLEPAAATAALPLLTTIRAHVDETLRLYPPGYILVRQAIGPDTIEGRPVAPGTMVSVAPWLLHRHRRLWASPDDYDPSRFAPDAPPPARFSYLPFGTGPRVCVGAQFALTEAVIVMARLLRRFRIDLAGPSAMLPTGVVTIQPDRPVRFVLTPR